MHCYLHRGGNVFLCLSVYVYRYSKTNQYIFMIFIYLGRPEMFWEIYRIYSGYNNKKFEFSAVPVSVIFVLVVSFDFEG